MTRQRRDRRRILAAVVASIFVAGTARAQWNDLFKKGQSLLTGRRRDSGSDLTNYEITRGLKEALRVGAATAVGRVGRVDGYNADPEIHLPLPSSLRPVKYALHTAGAPELLDNLELRLNRAAETAAPKAKRIFFSAIRQMTLNDARRIYNGPDDAATRYFERKMTPDLAAEMQPVVESSLTQVGAIRAFNEAMAIYKVFPIAPRVNADLTGYVVEKGIDGIFHYLAKEEAAIRRNPVKRTTRILRRVFGSA